MEQLGYVTLKWFLKFVEIGFANGAFNKTIGRNMLKGRAGSVHLWKRGSFSWLHCPDKSRPLLNAGPGFCPELILYEQVQHKWNE